jgi:hypothetical protein
MIKLKSKPQPKPEASTEVSLADRIKETCAAAKQYIEARVLEEKAAHPSIPIDWIRHNTYALGRSRSCHCKVALKLLDEKANG